MAPSLSLFYVIRASMLVILCFTMLHYLNIFRSEVIISMPVSYEVDQLLTDDFPENVKKLDQEDPLLQKYVKLRHLTPPSKLPYNFPKGTYMNGHSQVVAHIFRNKTNGTFFEAGAYDGVAASNSLYLEKEFGWRGLLVECNPYTIPVLKMKRRKAWIADVCLSPTKNPATLKFSNPTKWGPSARLGDPVDLKAFGVDTPWTKFEVEAMPLFALLSAVNLTEIDFFSLDVEGAEFDILKTIPFDKVRIKVIDMEVYFYSREVKNEINDFLKDKGFQLQGSGTSDHFYIHSSFKINGD